MALLTCSSSSSDCPYRCEQQGPSGPRIDLTPNGASIAAIETVRERTSSGSASGSCEVSWDISLFSTELAEPVCPAQPLDASWATDDCAQRYSCRAPNSYQLDGGYACTQARISLTADRCLVTVISTAGERQTFEAGVTGVSSSYQCNTGFGECIQVKNVSVSPSQITLTFASSGGDASEADGGHHVD